MNVVPQFQYLKLLVRFNYKGSKFSQPAIKSNKKNMYNQSLGLLRSII